jgi:hypothetical protein
MLSAVPRRDTIQVVVTLPAFRAPPPNSELLDKFGVSACATRQFNPLKAGTYGAPAKLATSCTDCSFDLGKGTRDIAPDLGWKP